MFSRRNHPARRARWIAGCIGTSTFVVATGTIGVQQAKASAVDSTDASSSADVDASLGEVDLSLDGGAAAVDTDIANPADNPTDVAPVEESSEADQVASQQPAAETNQPAQEQPAPQNPTPAPQQPAPQNPTPAPQQPAPQPPAPQQPAPEPPAPEPPAPQPPAPQPPAPEPPAPEPPAPEPPSSGGS